MTTSSPQPAVPVTPAIPSVTPPSTQQLSPGAIAGIVVGSVVGVSLLLLFLIAAVFLCWKCASELKMKTLLQGEPIKLGDAGNREEEKEELKSI